MNEHETNEWLTQTIPRYKNLTTTVVSILESLLRANNIDYLTVYGRTKKLASASEKLRRKKYEDPQSQLTDLSGVRVILYFESQVDRASKLVESSFKVDAQNSMNRDAILSVDQIGYRSVHYVCDLGADRTALPEYTHLANLKFEIQLRTVLQHAWAELAHDRNYKFSEKLPRPIERQLFLYAGMLEIADKGFDSLSQQIDTYIAEVKEKTEGGDFNIELDSVSLEQFVRTWTEQEKLPAVEIGDKGASRDLVVELRDYGIQTLSDLRAIIPPRYAELSKEIGLSTTIHGLIRDWMIMNNFERYRDMSWKNAWYEIGGPENDSDSLALYIGVLGNAQAAKIFETFAYHEQDDDHTGI